MKWLSFFFAWCLPAWLHAQTDGPEAPFIRSTQLYQTGYQTLYPVLSLNDGKTLQLEFDDMEGNVKNYFYTFQLCNADWTPVQLSTFDYIRGFAQNRITDYHYSSVALTRYTHYQASFPSNESAPTVSGNYLCKVFLDNDTSKTVFTKRFLVVSNGVSIAAQLQQPQNTQISPSFQKISFTVNTRALQLVNPFQQLKVVLMQNDRWDNAIYIDKPTFYSGTEFQYNTDDVVVFPGGKQWRWLDLRSFRFQSDRIAKVDYGKTATTVYLKPDPDRAPAPYYFYADYNGKYFLNNTDGYTPAYQSDYATVRFMYIPQDNVQLPDQDLYVFGAMTNYALNDSTRMHFNPAKGVYESSLFLKMGFYNYCYVTLDRNNPKAKASFALTEGNHFETENEYEILVYFRPLGGRADQLVGRYSMNTRGGQPQ